MDRRRKILDHVSITLAPAKELDEFVGLHARLSNGAEFPIFIMDGDIEFGIEEHARRVRLYCGYDAVRHQRPGVQIDHVMLPQRSVDVGGIVDWEVRYPRVLSCFLMGYIVDFQARVSDVAWVGPIGRVSEVAFGTYLAQSMHLISNEVLR